jgi:hypothetical protein
MSAVMDNTTMSDEYDEDGDGNEDGELFGELS